MHAHLDVVSISISFQRSKIRKHTFVEKLYSCWSVKAKTFKRLRFFLIAKQSDPKFKTQKDKTHSFMHSEINMKTTLTKLSPPSSLAVHNSYYLSWLRPVLAIVKENPSSNSPSERIPTGSFMSFWRTLQILIKDAPSKVHFSRCRKYCPALNNVDLL